MFRGWLGAAKPGAHGPTRSLNALDEISQIQDAMASVSHIMNDDVETAEELLGKGSSPFHQLGKGVVIFMRATLGFEQEIMREASNTLAEAENSAYSQQRHANKNPGVYQSSIYPAGTEYAVCQAEAQLMSAVVGVLNESLTEAIKSFYKLRKAYIALESIVAAEDKYLREREANSPDSTSRPSSKLSAKPSQVLSAPTEKPPKGNSSNGDDDDDFFDVDEDPRGVETPEYTGHISVSGDQNIQQDDSKTSKSPGAMAASLEGLANLTLSETVKTGQDIFLFGDHPVDVFIISGSNFCFGILLLLVSLVPPSFATLLKIVGFKGDRERGIQMLWQATKFHNIHGAMAGLVLFGFYNGVVGFCDIIPRQGAGSHPKDRCRRLLADMRKRYPKSHMWLLEEARMLASDKELEKSVAFMRKNVDGCPLKQLEALQWFELALNSMYMHDFEGTSDAFQKCVTMNNWSHGLYFFICGASHLELYRKNKAKNPEEAKKQAELATKFFKRVQANIGKKKFMARQLPFDTFVNRKIEKWEARAAEWKCDFIDAIGVSPLEEMNYFWNGYKRMKDGHLQTSLESLVWSEGAENPHWDKEGLDEKAILALLRATILRNLGQTTESKEILQTQIICHDRSLFKGNLKDSWTAPCARYEMAANLYREADKDGRPEEHMDLLQQCLEWMDEVAKWDSFDLDARIGMKIATAKSTLRRYRIEC